MDNQELIYRWLQLKIDHKYEDVSSKDEYWSAEISDRKFRVMKNYSQETLMDIDRQNYLDLLLQQVQILYSESPEAVVMEIDKMSRQDNKNE